MARSKDERLTIRKTHPDSWIAAEEGDYIRGPVTDVTEAWSDQRQNGSWYPLVTVKVMEASGYGFDPGKQPLPATGELRVHCFGAVIYNEVMRHRPEVDEVVTITYKGVGEAKGTKNPPELYVLRVEGRTDQAQRAYSRLDQLEGGASSRPGQPQQRRRPEPPVEASDFEQTPLQGADEDIPF